MIDNSNIDPDFTVLTHEMIFIDHNREEKISILISKDQLWIIENFANVEIHSDTNKYYIINNLKFRIIPIYDIKVQINTEDGNT